MDGPYPLSLTFLNTIKNEKNRDTRIGVYWEFGNDVDGFGSFKG